MRKIKQKTFFILTIVQMFCLQSFACENVPAWDPVKPYNVYGTETGMEVSMNGKVYKLKDQYAPISAGPESAWSYLWEFVRNCNGESGGNNENEENNNNENEPTQPLNLCLKKHLTIGYWHNFRNGAANGLKLTEVHGGYDFLNVSFGETDANDRAVITFHLDNSIYATDAAFISDIRTVQAEGKKVNLSLGGQNGIIHVKTASDKTKFVNSLIAIIDKYGFDGLDIDFEGTSAGGVSSSFKNPNAEAQLMVDGIREVCDYYGDDFILTMAPETAYVQFGINQGTAPAYLALIYGLRDKLTVLHVQLYNTGSSNDLYGNNAIPGTADYLVAMCDMMLQGFTNCGTTFPALREDQVAIGIPSCTGAAGSGIIAMSEVKKAMGYLITGIKPAGMNYVLKKSGGYPSFRGIMTWSVNWDASNNYELANTFQTYFNEIGNPLQNCEETAEDNESPTAPTNLRGTATETSIALTWTASADNVAVKGYSIYVDGIKKANSNATTYTVSGLSPNTSYLIEVEAYDAAANKSNKTAISLSTLVKTDEKEEENNGNENDGTETACNVPAWDAQTDYANNPGTEVSYNGKIYKTNTWYIPVGTLPTNSGYWEYIIDCDYQGVDTGIDYENGKKMVVYFPNWGTYNSAHLSISVDMIPWDKVTHINHAFFTVNSAFELVTTDSYADYQKQFAPYSTGWDDNAGHLGAYKYFKRNYPKVKVLISVGGWTRGENFHAMALTKAGRTTFINSIISFLKKHPYIDGIDIDWEYPGVNRTSDPNDSYDKGCPGGVEDKETFVLLMKEIREAYAANNMEDKLLTIAVSVNQNTIKAGPDPAAYAPYLDFINIMSYDMHGAFERTTNHHAAIFANPNDPTEDEIARTTFNAKSAGEYYASLGISKSKLNIGSPWYSRGWGGVSPGPNNDGLFQPATGYVRGSWDDTTTPAPGGQYPWFEIKKMESAAGWKKHFDESAGVPYLYNASSGVFLTYEDEKSLGMRCDFINKDGYGGLIVWEISGDDLNNGAPLTEIAYEKLFKGLVLSLENETIGQSKVEGVFDMYPNPVQDLLHIVVEDYASVSFFDLTGKMKFTQKLQPGINTIPFGMYEKGLYVVRVEMNGTIKSTLLNKR